MKKAELEKKGDRFHLKCRDFLGNYEGKLIAERLGLAAVDPPANGTNGDSLEVGQFYMSGGMSRHPELHAVVAEDKLEAVAELIRDFHMHVDSGRDLLPEVAEVELVHQEKSSYVEAIEERHKSAFQKGPKELVKAFLMRAIPGVIAIFAVVVLLRHVGDHHQSVSLSTALLRAQQPAPEQSFIDGIIDPDHSRSVRIQVRGVRFLDGNRLIFMDGHFVQVEGTDDLRPLFEQARQASVAPAIDAAIEDGKILIQKIRAGDETFLSEGEVVSLAKFAPSDEEPRRSIHKADNVFAQVTKLKHDELEALKQMQDARIALVGNVVEEDGRRVLRFDNGDGIVISNVSRSRDLDALFEAFTGDPAMLQVDLVMDTIYPWTSTKDPSQSRKETRLVGEGKVYSASAQNYHVIARR